MIRLEAMPKLGFGLMRLPQKDEVIDRAHVMAMVDAYMAQEGGHYFDTAYIYHKGTSESLAKDVLVSRYPRDSFCLATKLPAWCLDGPEDRDRIFQEQLDRCGVDYFDLYLLHSVEDGHHYEIYQKYDCFSWALQKKEAGQIRHFGFSYHGTPELLEQILDQHPEVEFVQIQLNYADWNNPLVQSGKLYEILRQRRIPMVIMEPVKGGTLAELPPELAEIFKEASPDASLASWALRFAASLDGVMTVLSGMSSLEQMRDNLDTFRSFVPLSPEEEQVVQRVVRKMQDTPLIQCTSCKYCCDGCPMSIPIPDIIRALNTVRLYPKDDRPKAFYEKLTAQGAPKASECASCGQCESVCPQHLPIMGFLQDAVELFE
ncbi:MAG: aldo/keto reductase [Eubacteriales bacterium]|nr:aldo/keto reductase [Eubacteriales bacterium]